MKFSKLSHFMLAFVIIAIFSTFFNVSTSGAASFGISPPWVKSDYALPGKTFEQVINLSRSDSEKDMKAEIKITGDKKLVKWIKIQDEKKLIMKKGQKILPMKVTVKIPKRATLKNYKGNINVIISPVEEDDSLGGGTVSIRLGANIDIDITVTGEKVTDYWIKTISVDKLREGDPFGLNVEMKNIGNTEISSIKGQIDIYDSKKTEIIKSLAFIPFDKISQPYETEKFKMLFVDTILDPGEYRVVVKVLKDGETAYENNLFQEVKKKVIPIITPEYVASDRPSLPGTAEDKAVTSPVMQMPASNMMPVAPAVATAGNTFLILGLAGFGFGLIAIIGLIVVLVIVLKNQQRTAGTNYSVQNQPPENQFEDSAKDNNSGAEQ